MKYPMGEKYIETLTEEEYVAAYGELDDRHELLRIEEKIRHCKADVFERSVHGTVCVPARHDEGEKYARFYMDADRLLLIGGNEWSEEAVCRITEENIFDMTTCAQALFAFLDGVIYDEGEYIDELEESLNGWENKMLESGGDIPEGFEEYMQRMRRKLIKDYRYYDQLGDMAQALAESPCEIIDKKAGRMYKFLSDRMDRLSQDALNLREYSSQIYDMYQSRINLRQNKIMQFLTVITTIFMPLTLVTGWYGMNFDRMPELHWRYGYAAVLGLSAVLLLIEYIVFRRKKWM